MHFTKHLPWVWWYICIPAIAILATYALVMYGKKKHREELERKTSFLCEKLDLPESQYGSGAFILENYLVVNITKDNQIFLEHCPVNLAALKLRLGDERALTYDPQMMFPVRHVLLRAEPQARLAYLWNIWCRCADMRLLHTSLAIQEPQKLRPGYAWEMPLHLPKDNGFWKKIAPELVYGSTTHKDSIAVHFFDHPNTGQQYAVLQCSFNTTVGEFIEQVNGLLSAKVFCFAWTCMPDFDPQNLQDSKVPLLWVKLIKKPQPQDPAFEPPDF